MTQDAQKQVILLSNVRLAFPNLIEPQRQIVGEGKERISYNCELLMPQDHPGFQQFMAAYGELALAKWAEHAQTVMGMIQNDRKSRCYGRGEEKVNKKTFQPYDGYAGNVYISTGRNTAPQIFETGTGKLLDPNNTMGYQQLTRKMYAGCRVNVAVSPWIQDNSYGRAIRCDLIAIQFAGDDTQFGAGGVDVSNLFGAVAGQAAPAAAATPAGMPLPPFMQG